MPNQTQAKYHHLIPQTYMSPWANASGTLKVEFISEPGVVIERNKEKIAGVKNGVKLISATENISLSTKR